MEKTYWADNPEDLDVVAEAFLKDFPDCRVIALEGEMGAGKTTFTKYVCKRLSVEDNVCSPTFAIVNEYRSYTHGSVYHFDFYRINSCSEALDIGLEEYLYSGNYCFMEWSGKIEELIPDDCTYVYIKDLEGRRKITVIDK